MKFRHFPAATAAALLTIATITTAAIAAAGASAAPTRYIVQAATVQDAHRHANRLGATVERDLAVINGVSVYLDPWQVKRLRTTPGGRLYEGRDLSTPGLLTLLRPVQGPV